MQSFTRGATVHAAVRFTGADGLPVSPSAATLSLSFPNVSGLRTSVDIALALSGSDWVTDWDSRVAGEGVVFGHVRTAVPLPLSASNFEFALVTNRANPNPS